MNRILVIVIGFFLGVGLYNLIDPLGLDNDNQQKIENIVTSQTVTINTDEFILIYYMAVTSTEIMKRQGKILTRLHPEVFDENSYEGFHVPNLHQLHISFDNPNITVKDIEGFVPPFPEPEIVDPPEETEPSGLNV